MTREIRVPFLTFMLCALVLLQSCNDAPSFYKIPTHIVFDTDAGTWNVATSGMGDASQLPHTVGVTSVHQKESRDGIWFYAGTAGYRQMVKSYEVDALRQPSDITQHLMIPGHLEYNNNNWKVVFRVATISATDVELISKFSYSISVPVVTSKCGDAGLAYIENERKGL
jgi:hypothetical protein